MRASSVLMGFVLVSLVACGDRPPTEGDVVGVYRADLPGTATPGRAVSLDLQAGNAAELAIDYQDGTAPVVETGTWAVQPNGGVRIVLARNVLGPVTTDVTFRWSRATLTAVAFDTVRWGGSGFALVRE